MRLLRRCLLSPLVIGRAFSSTKIGTRLERKVVSYRDVCLGLDSGPGSLNEDGFSGSDTELEGSEDLDSDEEFLRKLDPLCPIVKLSRMEKKCICIPWKRAIIVNLLGKKIGLRMLQTRLPKLWQTMSNMEIIDMENDYFLVRFSNLDDLKHVVENGLPVEYYDSTVLKRIGNSLGHTIKIDSNTLRQRSDATGELCMERAKFVRISVEVNLKEALISRFMLNGRRYRVEFEGFHMVCFNCGCYGHRKESRPSVASETNKEFLGEERDTTGLETNANQKKMETIYTVADGGFSPWMLVQRGGRRAVPSTREGGGKNVGISSKKSLISNNKGIYVEKNEILEVPDKSLVGPIKSPSIKYKTASNDMGKSHQESVAASETTRQLRGNSDKSSIAEDNGRDLPLSHNGNNELTGRKATWPFVSHGDLGQKEFAYVENNVRISMSSMGLDQSSLGLAYASSYKPPDGILIGGIPTGSLDPTCSPNQQQDDIISNMDCEVNPSEDCVVIDTLETMVSPTPSLS
ncbi:hypothetical protein SESBI_24226 [Sesbania bispinosa]|nr:hypothetical protein SESBI_24226 [Sesbania bispinosa]